MGQGRQTARHQMFGNPSIAIKSETWLREPIRSATASAAPQKGQARLGCGLACTGWVTEPASLEREA